MNRTRWSVAALALALGMGGAAAQDTRPPVGAPSGGTGDKGQETAPPTHRADAAPVAASAAKLPPAATDAVVLDATSLTAVSGRSVKSATGEDMGRIVDILVQPSGQVRAAIIDFGGFLGVGSRKIAVDWKAMNFADVGKSGDVIVALTRNQVRMAPEYKQGDPVVVLEATTPEQTKAPPKPGAPMPPAAVNPHNK